jgi:predicted Zn-dependent protease
MGVQLKFSNDWVKRLLFDALQLRFLKSVVGKLGASLEYWSDQIVQ